MTDTDPMREALKLARKRIEYLGSFLMHRHQKANETEFFPIIDAALAAQPPAPRIHDATTGETFPATEARPPAPMFSGKYDPFNSIVEWTKEVSAPLRGREEIVRIFEEAYLVSSKEHSFTEPSMARMAGIDAILALQPAVSQHERGVMVPKAPDALMLAAGWEQLRRNIPANQRLLGAGPALIEAWQAMLANVPAVTRAERGGSDV